MKIYHKKPEWLRVRKDNTVEYSEVNNLIVEHDLHTVCKSARCPNANDCWSRRTATFMILGDVCTRSCRFCAVKTGKPPKLDLEEPIRVAEAVGKLELKYAVITSVNRDELEDGGASVFAATIREIRKIRPECKIEVLIPDFKGDFKALDVVLEAGPDVLNHNVETVERLYKEIRPQAKYKRSLDVLYHAKEAGFITKSGFMVGLGEETEEIHQLLRDLREHRVDIVTIGQYLQPSLNHAVVKKYYHPKEFYEFKRFGESIGIPHVESGPLVRSSYHADEVEEKLRLGESLG
ncbi:MAG: lipoyl synthase [Calditrichia bacterium]